MRVSISPVHRGDLVATETGLPDGSAGRRLGTEAVGVVTAVSPSVPALRVDDRVAVFPALGAWSEHITVPAQAPVAVPDSLSDETASVLLVNTITSRDVLRAVDELRAAAAAPSDSPLLVSGAASAVGKLIVQQARDRGWPVVAVVRSDRSASTVRTNWPDVPVVVSGSGGWQRELEGAVGGTPVPVIADAHGGPLPSRRSCRLPARRAAEHHLGGADLRHRHRIAQAELTKPGPQGSSDLMEFKTIGTIGAGAPAQAVAAHAARAGHPVLVSNSRGPSTLGDAVAAIGPGASAATFEEAAAADLVLLAVPFGAVPAVGRRLGDWTGRVVVDITNQFARSDPYRGFADVSPLTGSEWVAQQLPGVTLIKAFNDMFATYMAPDPRHQDGNQVVFLAGDDESAKAPFTRLLTEFGFAPVDLGALREGGALMQLGGPLSGKHFLFQG
ncbi:hypothetical protein TNCT1_42160 [Streptomyces sp. 1-11]|nr:NAD(P)-binding domain-containing protein [Streptomyces sp. 1-11]GEK01940.1 hypothetical protein TNCT1_42160 [Streptomyces sp. 1-11]